MAQLVSGDEEGLPVAILEAMSYLLPVVSTGHAGIPEAVLEGVTAFLGEEKAFEIKARSQFLFAWLTAFSTSIKRTSQTVSNESVSTSKHQQALGFNL
jgi:glycosyltransferase involved in cell wall biosynthesis